MVDWNALGAEQVDLCMVCSTKVACAGSASQGGRGEVVRSSKAT
jgi:hypothetical protein